MQTSTITMQHNKIRKIITTTTTTTTKNRLLLIKIDHMFQLEKAMTIVLQIQFPFFSSLCLNLDFSEAQ